MRFLKDEISDRIQLRPPGLACGNNALRRAVTIHDNSGTSEQLKGEES